MHPTVKAARGAGLLYLLSAIPAPFSIIYLPKKLIVPGNAAATASNILASQMLFRLGIVGELISAIFFVLLAMALYRLLSEVNKNHGRLMVGLVLVSVAITFVNVVNNIAALTLFRGGDFIPVMDKPQRDALAMVFLSVHSQGIIVNQIFWGLWLFPFGMLVYRSGFLPRFLGVWLIINGFGLLALSFTSLLLPQYEDMVFNITFPALMGEIATILWLLIRGAKVQPLPSAAS